MVGAVVAIACVWAIEAVSHLIYPIPPGTDFDDPAVLAAYFESVPLGAKLWIVAAWFVGRATRHYLGRPDSNSLQFATMTARAARWTVIVVGASWSLSFLGAETGWFAITITLVLVLIVQIMKPALEKLGAGFALTSRPAFKIGDDIGVKDLQGTVLEITGRSTVLACATDGEPTFQTRTSSTRPSSSTQQTSSGAPPSTSRSKHATR